jgi:GNAT superfamily N-acetyltransferase
MILRRATPGDATAVAAIYLASRAAASPDVAWAHGDEDVRGWIAGVLLDKTEVTVAGDGSVVHGYIARDGEWVNHLFIHPLSWRLGLGSRLITHAKSAHPASLRLWTFQSNTRARAFYERHGFTAAQFTDGEDNEEREPDMLYVWAG